MAHVALNLSRLTAPELLDLAAHLREGLTDNPNFPHPQPPLDELQDLVAKLDTMQEDYRVLRLRLNELKTRRDHAVELLSTAVARAAGYVDQASGGDPEKILSANLHAEPEVHLWPFRRLGQVYELSASAGDERGEVDLTWDPVRGAEGYEVENSRDLGGHGPWKLCATTTASRTTVGRLENSIRYWFRVRAMNDRGSSKWSDPVTKYSR